MANEPAFNARAYGRRNMLARHGMTESDLAPKATAAQIKADALAALPKSIEEAGGDARAYGRADMKRRVAAAAGKGAPASSGAAASRASMERLLRASGREPVKR